jgi:serine/threonine protein kinase
MSPEQVLGKEVDSRSDVYSLGILLFQLSTGQMPFSIKTLTEALKAHTQQPPPKPRSIRPEIPQTLETIILKCLEKAANDRYKDASDLALALRCTTDPTRIGAAPAIPVGRTAAG